MKVISFLNKKGGVGKSTTTSNLMAYFTSKGKKVLGIDTDSQGHLSKLCGAVTVGENTIMELLQSRATFAETIQHTKFGDIIPADVNLEYAMLQFSTIPDFMFRLKDILDKDAKAYDYILIDCAPSINSVTTATLVASDYVIIPTEAEYLALDGVTELARVVDSVKGRINQKLQVLGLIAVKYNPRRKLTQELERYLNETGKKIFSAELLPVKIRNTVDIPMSQRNRMSIFEYKPNSNVAKEYANLGEEILRRI